jgi:hypothetical protein
MCRKKPYLVPGAQFIASLKEIGDRSNYYRTIMQTAGGYVDEIMKLIMCANYTSILFANHQPNFALNFPSSKERNFFAVKQPTFFAIVHTKTVQP